MSQYVWQTSTWPTFSWDSGRLLNPLGRVRQRQGAILAKAEFIGVNLEAETLIEEAFTTSAIEGVSLDRNSIRSSVARRLGLPVAGLPPTAHNVDGLVELLIDATTGYDSPLSQERLWGWHVALFPTGYSGIHKITVGAWRDGTEPMQVVSGPIGKERVHFEAPGADRLEQEMTRFLVWWHGESSSLEGIIRAGLAHFWFVTIHPFADGNGRLARAITDMALAQDERTKRRLYSMSAQIGAERDDYYRVLEETQKGNGDVTDWLVWFSGCLERAILQSEVQVQTALQKARFWRQHLEAGLNKRQRKVINRLLDAGPGGFEGGLNNRKYVGLTKASRESAKRDIAALLKMGILEKNPGGGRSASYNLVWPA